MTVYSRCVIVTSQSVYILHVVVLRRHRFTAKQLPRMRNIILPVHFRSMRYGIFSNFALCILHYASIRQLYVLYPLSVYLYLSNFWSMICVQLATRVRTSGIVDSRVGELFAICNSSETSSGGNMRTAALTGRMCAPCEPFPIQQCQWYQQIPAICNPIQCGRNERTDGLPLAKEARISRSLLRVVVVYVCMVWYTYIYGIQFTEPHALRYPSAHQRMYAVCTCLLLLVVLLAAQSVCRVIAPVCVQTSVAGSGRLRRR